MAGHVGIIQIGHPGPDGEDAYWENGTGARLSAMYGELLGMEPIDIGYHKLVHADGSIPEIGFEYAPEDAPPRWGDPERPQQVHLDIEVADVDAARTLVVAHGATPLHQAPEHHVLADPVGHPFCLHPAARRSAAPGRIARIVFDCFSPRALARFYAELLSLPDRVVDTPERVVITAPGAPVDLAFQHVVCAPPRWPDPAHPAQLHLDIGFEDHGGRDLVERLGGVRREVPGRPDHLVYVDPAGHPFCVGLGGWGTYGPAQVAEYEAWLASEQV